MKTKWASCIWLVLFGVGLSFGQGKAMEVNNYRFGQPEHYLDGYSMNFQYQNGVAIHMIFYDGRAKYEWVGGPSRGNEDTCCRDCQGLFDFDKMLMHNSIIIGYRNKPERRLKTILQSGKYDQLKRATK